MNPARWNIDYCQGNGENYRQYEKERARYQRYDIKHLLSPKWKRNYPSSFDGMESRCAKGGWKYLQMLLDAIYVDLKNDFKSTHQIPKWIHYEIIIWKVFSLLKFKNFFIKQTLLTVHLFNVKSSVHSLVCRLQSRCYFTHKDVLFYRINPERSKSTTTEFPFVSFSCRYSSGRVKILLRSSV